MTEGLAILLLASMAITLVGMVAMFCLCVYWFIKGE